MPSLGGGGAERVVSILLNNINRDIYSVNLILLFKNVSNDYLINLKEDVVIHYFNLKKNKHYSILSMVYRAICFSYKKKPDILFFGFGAYNTIFSFFLSFFPKKTIFIARETSIPSKYENRFLIKLLYKFSYKKFDKIIVQSNDMLDDLNQVFNIPLAKMVKINNPVDFENITFKSNQDINFTFSKAHINLISVGRLSKEKGYDLLIKEVSKIKDLDFHLYLIGNGPLRSDLEELTKKYSLEQHVSFIGFVKNPYAYLKKADIFILSSRFEGFPNAVLESLSCGIPVLANNCLSDMSQIIKPNFNGEIFSFEENDFQKKLQIIIKGNYDRTKISKDTKKRFSIENTIQKFDDVFQLKNNDYKHNN